MNLLCLLGFTHTAFHVPGYFVEMEETARFIFIVESSNYDRFLLTVLSSINYIQNGLFEPKLVKLSELLKIV